MFPPELLQWGASVVLAVQSLGNPVFDALARGLNFFGTVDFYFILLPFLYWCVDKRAAFQILVGLLLADYFARVLKGLFNVTRPYDLDLRIRNLDPQGDASFPSAAAVGASFFWTALALWRQQVWITVLAVVVIASVAFARMYLGAHYPFDVAGGILLGVALAFAWQRVPWNAVWVKLANAPFALGLALVPIALAALYPVKDTVVSMGALCGALAGISFEITRVRFAEQTEWWKQIVKLALGLGVAFLVRTLLKEILPEALWADFVRYAVIGIWLALGAPFLFVKIRLSPQKNLRGFGD
jgi:membrane-associated phospholipid phosphatase